MCGEHSWRRMAGCVSRPICAHTPGGAVSGGGVARGCCDATETRRPCDRWCATTQLPIQKPADGKDRGPLLSNKRPPRPQSAKKPQLWIDRVRVDCVNAKKPIVKLERGVVKCNCGPETPSTFSQPLRLMHARRCWFWHYQTGRNLVDGRCVCR